jgi:hypothetical protein
VDETELQAIGELRAQIDEAAEHLDQLYRRRAAMMTATSEQGVTLRSLAPCWGISAAAALRAIQRHRRGDTGDTLQD